MGNLNRIVYIDYLKAFSVILMIIGHCIQFGNGQYNGYNVCNKNIVYIMIYSFHMPLFALISGYLFGLSAMRKNIVDVVISKIQSLFIPLFAWQLLINIYIVYKIGGVKRIITGFIGIYGNMWFLWAMVFCSIIAVVGYYFVKKSIWFYCLVFLLTFMIPYRMPQLWVWVLPFFVVGSYYATNGYFNKLVTYIITNKTNLVVLSVIWFTLCFFWKPDYYIYVYKMNLLFVEDWQWRLWCNIYRLVAGFIGSGVFFALFYNLNKVLKVNWIVSIISRYSIGFYVFSVHFLNNWLRAQKDYTFSWMRTLLESLVITVICIIVMWGLSKISITRKWLLGDYRSKH